MSDARIVEVKPFYGWGWSDSENADTLDNIPPPFRASVRQGSEVWFGKAIKTLRGRIEQAEHAFDGFEVLLSPRHDPWDGHVNVTLKNDGGRELVGFGEIGLASFE